MSRRAPLPGASELFRRTTRPSPGTPTPGDGAREPIGAAGAGADGTGTDEKGAQETGARGTGADGSGAGDPARPDPAGADSAGADPAGDGTGPTGGRSPSGGDAPGGDGDQRRARTAPRKGSGRQRHDAKITVYVSGDELLAMEQARLTLRGSHDLVVDRGRIVREAVAVLLADFEEHAEESVLVRRLRDTHERTDGASGGSGGTAP